VHRPGREIHNRGLRLADIPPPQADWDVIGAFALTFDGYRHWGSFEACAEVANAKRDGSLTELRTCLFFEQLRWRHFGDEPDAGAMTYIRGIVESIRARVASGAVD
jgi:hypothetical protein